MYAHRTSRLLLTFLPGVIGLSAALVLMLGAGFAPGHAAYPFVILTIGAAAVITTAAFCTHKCSTTQEKGSTTLPLIALGVLILALTFAGVLGAR